MGIRMAPSEMRYYCMCCRCRRDGLPLPVTPLVVRAQRALREMYKELSGLSKDPTAVPPSQWKRPLDPARGGQPKCPSRGAPW